MQQPPDPYPQYPQQQWQQPPFPQQPYQQPPQYPFPPSQYTPPPPAPQETKLFHTRGIQEMSQYHSSMFSDAVYLFAKIFSSAPIFGNEEELPDGTWVNQSKLAVQVVLAAFAYLYHKKLIDIVLEERKFLFLKKKTAKVKKLQSTAPDTSGLEAVIFTSIRDNSDIYGITRALIDRDDVFTNPWCEVLKFVKKNLLDRGILKLVAKKGNYFFTTHKYVVNGDISRDISKAAKQIAELKKTLEELQSKGELYERILSAIEDGFASHVDTG